MAFTGKIHVKAIKEVVSMKLNVNIHEGDLHHLPKSLCAFQQYRRYAIDLVFVVC
jgi:hypothetical protein